MRIRITNCPFCTGNNQLRSAALPVIPAELAKGEHQEGGLLDHLQYHRRQQATNSGQLMYVAYHVSIQEEEADFFMDPVLGQAFKNHGFGFYVIFL